MASPTTTGTRRGPRHKQPQPKRVPLRTCVGCHTIQPKRQLVRLVRTAQGSVEIDPTGKAQGRGAYLHNRRECWEKALASSALDHALKATLTEAERVRLRAHGEQYSNDD